MREKWARRIVLLTALIVLLLAFVFARIQNPDQIADRTKSGEQVSSSERKPSVVLNSKAIERGRQIYEQQGCGFCHSIDGQGNPRNPLDGVGTKRTASELRNFITGADTLEGLLTTSIRKMKQKYKELSADELDALVIYMQSL